MCKKIVKFLQGYPLKAFKIFSLKKILLSIFPLEPIFSFFQNHPFQAFLI